MKTENCAETKMFEFTSLKPKIFFNADIVKSGSRVEVYVKKIPYPIQITVQNQRGIILQNRLLLQSNGSSIYPSSHYRSLDFAVNFLDYGQSILHLLVHKMSDQSLLYEKTFSIFRSFCPEFTILFDNPNSFTFSTSDLITGKFKHN